MAVMIGQTTPDAGSAAPTEAPATAKSGNVEGVVKTPPATTEFGGRDGPDPTRFGDWEKNGRCIDF